MANKKINVFLCLFLSMIILLSLILLINFNITSNITYASGTTYYYDSNSGWVSSPNILKSGDMIDIYNWSDESKIYVKVDGTTKLTVDKLSNDAFNVDNYYKYEKIETGSGYVNIVLSSVTVYSVMYDLNGGSGTTPTDTKTYIEGDALTFADTNGITKEGFSIKGWALTNDATAGLSTYNINSADAASNVIKFYAVWVHKHGNSGDTGYMEFSLPLTYDYLDGLTNNGDGNTELTSGNYYLASNATIDSNIKNIIIPSGQTVNICLNGYTLDLVGYYIQNNGTLTIYDCQNAGIIKGDKTNKQGYYSTELNYQGGAIYNNAGTLTINGGTFTENYADQGGAIYNNNGAITINAGTFDQNIAFISGGAIYNNLGTLTINGGTFTNNSASGSPHTFGGAIYIAGGTVNISGATFGGASGKGNLSHTGGAIYNLATLTIGSSTIISYNGGAEDVETKTGGAICNDGTLTISGGTISYNSSTVVGGAISNSGNATLTLSGGTISNNTSEDGGAICNDGTLIIIGGTISNNSATNSGGAIVNEYFEDGGIVNIRGTIIVGGSAIISGNTVNSKANNVYLVDNTSLTVGVDANVPTSTMSVGITLESGYGTFVTGDTTNNKQYFTSDNDDYLVVVQEIAGSPKTYSYSLEQKYSVTYNKNASDIVSNIPSDNSKYAENDTVTISTGLPIRENYIFLGWSSTQNGEVITTATISMPNSNLTLFAQWLQVITSQPTKDNDYKITVDNSLTNVTYQWYKYIPSYTNIEDSTKVKLEVGTDNDNGTYSSINAFGSQTILFTAKDDADISKLYIQYTLNGNVYINSVRLFGKSGAPIIGLGVSGAFMDSTVLTISDVKIIEYAGEILTGETNDKLGSTTLTNVSYVCKVSDTSGVIATSSILTPKAISFAGGDSATGTAPITQYQLENRQVTLPANTFTRVNYNFLGWNTNKDATAKLNSYLAGDSDATLYAIWEAKQSIDIDFSTIQRYEHDGNVKSVVLKDTTGKDITLSGFTITYHKGSSSGEVCENPTDIGYYVVSIHRDEDATYQSVDGNINFIITYTVTYKANTGVGDDVYDDGSDYSTGVYVYAPSGTVGANLTQPIAIANNTFTKEGYDYCYWNTKEDGTGTRYAGGEQINITGNLILYACYVPLISEEPSKDNNYTVSVATSDPVTYQWYKNVYVVNPLGSYTITKGTDEGNGVYSSIGNEIKFYLSGIGYLRFTSTIEISGLQEIGDKTYVCAFVPFFGAPLPTISASESFTISNLAVLSTEAVLLEGETGASIKNATENDVAYYNCKVKSKFNVEAESNAATPTVVKFMANGGEGSVDSIYQLENRTITLPTSGYTKKDYKFIGWNTNSDATTTLDSYTVLNSGNTLYAIWESLEYDKDFSVTITPALKYGVKDSEITIAASDSDLKITEWHMYLYDTIEGTCTAKTTIDVPGSYLFMIIVEGNTENYWFANVDDVYKKTVTVLYASEVYAYAITSYDISDANFAISPTHSTKLGLQVIFNISSYTVTYDDNVESETITVPEDKSTYMEGELVAISSTTPSRDGYNFLGWNIDKDATLALTFEDNKYVMGDSNVTFYAIWEDKYYSKNFKVTFPTITEYTKAEDIEISTDHDDELTLESVHILQSLATGGVEYIDSISKPGEYMVLAVLTAKDGKAFKKGTYGYVIGYLSCTGGECGGTMVASAYDFTKTFDQEGFATLGATDDDDIKLLVILGVLIEGGNTISFNANTTDTITGLPEDATYFKGTPISLPTPSTRAGYNFLGWNTDKDATSVITFEDNKYVMGDSDVTLYAIWAEKTAVSIIETKQTYTYNGTKQGFEIKGTHKDIGSFVVKYYVDDAWTLDAPINAGSYDVKITRAEDDTYLAYEKEIEDGITINKFNVTVTIDKTSFVYNGEDQQSGLKATYKDVNDQDIALTLDYVTPKDFNSLGFINAGNYIASFVFDTEAESKNYSLGEYEDYEVEVAINKQKVNEPTIKSTYIYLGQPIVPEFNGVLDCMEIKEGATAQNEPGFYKTEFTLDSNHEWAEGSDGFVDWKILKQEDEYIEPDKEEAQVKVEYKEGFDPNISLQVKVTEKEEIPKTQLSVDYNNLQNEEIKLKSNEVVGVVFDVKLIKTVDGVDSVIQPSDIKAGATITVKFTIPSYVNVDKISRILHVHTFDNIESILFDKSNYDPASRYYTMETDSFSEFAFIYIEDTVVEPTKDSKDLTPGAIAGITIGSIFGFILILFITLFILWKNEFDEEQKYIEENKKANVDVELEVKAKYTRKLKFLDPVYRPINHALFGGKKEA